MKLLKVKNISFPQREQFSGLFNAKKKNMKLLSFGNIHCPLTQIICKLSYLSQGINSCDNKTDKPQGHFMDIR